MKKYTSLFQWILVMAFAAVFAVSCIYRSYGQREQEVAVDSPAVLQDIPEGWEPMMDGKTLAGWEIVRFGGEGEPFVKNGVLVLPMAVYGLMTGVSWDGPTLPKNNYAIYYEARRMEGNDIFGGLSFPYKDSYATLIVGGWGGVVCGLSCIDGRDASENETTKYINFKDEQWYPINLRVTTDSICAVIDTVQVVNIATAGRRIHLRGGTLAPDLTLCTYLTTGEIRNLRIKKLP